MSESHTSASLDKYELFIFDLDGTLYDQKKLRRKLLIHLIIQLIKGNISLNEIKIISSFRKQRENHKSYTSMSLNTDQYLWVQENQNFSAEKIAVTIERWMYQFPLPFLLSCRYKGAKGFFRELRRKAKFVAVYSDFPPTKKMQSLQMEADMYLCSTDSSVNQLKPSARGINIICEAYNIAKEKVIFIGDREDTDGGSAGMAKTDFLLVDVEKARKGVFFPELTKRL